MVILNYIVMHADQPDLMFTILRTIMVDYWNGLKEEVMAVREKNIIYILMKNKPLSLRTKVMSGIAAGGTTFILLQGGDYKWLFLAGFAVTLFIFSYFYKKNEKELG